MTTWRLVAPWYAREAFGGAHPRDTPPVLQQYASADLVSELYADPRRSLPFAAEAGGTRKLFLATHRRFYLVVCELHCDVPGFPDARREAVCQAGVVVRRRRPVHPPEGWVASGVAGIGAWTALDDEAPREAVTALYPLVADPGSEGHAAAGRAIWFGLLPTGSADAELDGSPRFDDASVYEAACFVRRHDERCPRAAAGRRRADCRGELVWSLATETWRLASHDEVADRPALATVA